MTFRIFYAGKDEYGQCEFNDFVIEYGFPGFDNEIQDECQNSTTHYVQDDKRVTWYMCGEHKQLLKDRGIAE